MVELLEIIHEALENGLTWATAISVFLAIHKVIEGKHKRKVSHQMRDDIQSIKTKLGIGETSTPTAMKRSSLLQSLQAVTRRGNRRRKTDMQINRAILLPLLAAIASFVKSAFGYEISDEHVNSAADLILFGFMLAGIFIHPRKVKEVEVPADAEHTDLSDAY